MPEQPVSEPEAATPPAEAAAGSRTAPEPAGPPPAVPGVPGPDSGVPDAAGSGLPGPDSGGPDSGGPDAAGADPELPVVAEVDSGKFTVRLTNFTGPFDLLLQLIGKHKLDVTEIALHQVTDDFIAYIRAMGDDWDLGETSEFLLVAATLLDLKAARLLPSAEVEDEDDLALLEAGDLLFARLLQYKAYKEAAAVIADLEGIGARRWPRAVTLEPRYAEALPDLVLGFGPERLLKLALKQFLPKPGPPEVSIAHIHQVRVSVREHATLIRDRLRRAGSATFSLLIADCQNTLEVVARFLALLELYREGLIDFEQPVSLEEMTVRWIGGDQAEGDLDIDDYEGSPPEPDTAATDPDDINLDDLDSDPTPAESAAAALTAADEDNEDDDEDLEVEDVDYAALADAALAGRRGTTDLDDENTDAPAPAESAVIESDTLRADAAVDQADSTVGEPGAVASHPADAVAVDDTVEPEDPADSAESVAIEGEALRAGAAVEPEDPADSAASDAFEGGAFPGGEPDAVAGLELPAGDESRAAPAGIPGTGHHTADRVSTDEEQS